MKENGKKRTNNTKLHYIQLEQKKSKSQNKHISIETLK